MCVFVIRDSYCLGQMRTGVSGPYKITETELLDDSFVCRIFDLENVTVNL